MPVAKATPIAAAAILTPEEQTPAIMLPDSVSSPQDVAALVVDIRAYAKRSSHTLIKQRVASRPVSNTATDTDTTDAPDLAPVTQTLLATWANGQPLTQAKLDELTDELQYIIDTAPTVTITLAAPPSSGLKKQLVGWCRANLASDVLVSFNFNATLLGGMVVRFGSHIYDWSFRRQILENRSKIPEVLRNVR